MGKYEPQCHACQGKLPKHDRCKCGRMATHTHHDYPDQTLDCEVCHGLCSAPVPVYSCLCGQQFVYGEFSDETLARRFDNFPPCWR